MRRSCEAGTLQPGEEETLWDLMNVYKYFKGGLTEDGSRLFSVMPRARTEAMGIN